MSSRQQSEKILKKGLLEYGLRPREVEVLLAILQGDQMTVGKIAKICTSIPRTSVYDIVSALRGRGFVSIQVQRGRTYYIAQGVEHVVDLLEEERQKVFEKQQQLRVLVGAFSQVKEGGLYRPFVRFFEGKGGVLAIQREVQDARKETSTIVNLEAIKDKYPAFVLQDNLRDFQKFHVRKRDLFIQNKAANEYLQVAPINEFHEARWLSTELSFETDTLIWEDHVAMIDYEGKPSGLIIDNPAIYKTFLAWFEIMWGISMPVVPGK